MNKVDLAYIAGIVDGEGSITLPSYNRGTRYPVVSVDSVDRELLEWLQATIGGTIVTKAKYQDHHKQAYTWRVTRNAALQLLADILPYLRIERKKARASLLVNEYIKVTPRNGKYTDEMKLAKEELVQKFHQIV